MDSRWCRSSPAVLSDIPGISSSEGISAQSSGSGCPDASNDSASTDGASILSFRSMKDIGFDHGTSRPSAARLKTRVSAKVRCVILLLYSVAAENSFGCRKNTETTGVSGGEKNAVFLVHAPLWSLYSFGLLKKMVSYATRVNLPPGLLPTGFSGCCSDSPSSELSANVPSALFSCCIERCASVWTFVALLTALASFCARWTPA
jgi:hypothetical protein